MTAEIVRKDSIQELCGHRARALELYRQAFDCLAQARNAHRRACVGQVHLGTIPHDHFRLFSIDQITRDRERYDEDVRKMVDRDMWHGFIINTPLGKLMDRQERDRFENSLKEQPPEATPETVFATMARLAGEADTIFRRGLANAFARLSRDFASHDWFKLGSRIIIRGLFTVYRNERDKPWLSFNYRWEDELRDVERVFAVLDGKPQPTYQQGIAQALRDRRQAGEEPRECETEYFKLRWFLNGNAHLWFKRDDLMRQANKLLAEHYGDALGVGPDAAGRR